MNNHTPAWERTLGGSLQRTCLRLTRGFCKFHPTSLSLAWKSTQPLRIFLSWTLCFREAPLGPLLSSLVLTKRYHCHYFLFRFVLLSSRSAAESSLVSEQFLTTPGRLVPEYPSVSIWSAQRAWAHPLLSIACFFSFQVRSLKARDCRILTDSSGHLLFCFTGVNCRSNCSWSSNDARFSTRRGFLLSLDRVLWGPCLALPFWGPSWLPRKKNKEAK